ncbi:MAG: hypothetical protein RLO12_01440 [Fulvivirga sp.]
MSWDLFVQDWGNVRTLNEIPEDFQPQPIGTRSEIIQKIKDAEPTVNFEFDTLGVIENEHFSIEFNMGSDELLNSFSMHVRGNELAIPCIGNILKHINLRAADGSNGEFFNTDEATEKLENWIKHRNKLLE